MRRRATNPLPTALALAFLAGWSSACKSPAVAPGSVVKAKATAAAPAPSLQPFLDLGCTSKEGILSCPALVGDFACTYTSADGYAGLGLPIIECGFGATGRCGGAEDRPGAALARSAVEGDLGKVGCMCPLRRRMLVATAAGIEPIYTRAELASRIGPIDSEDKALAYAAAVTDGEILRVTPEEGPNWTTKGADRTPSFSRREGASFVVRLFADVPCRCMTPNELTFTDYAVAADGGVRALRSGPAGRQKKGDVCVD